jgi:hypothetical protein
MTFEDAKRIRQNPTAEDCDNKELARLIDIALEKQIPKKPNVIGFEQNKLISSVHYSCSACDRLLSRYKYCPECGQALDWSDTE